MSLNGNADTEDAEGPIDRSVVANQISMITTGYAYTYKYNMVNWQLAYAIGYKLIWAVLTYYTQTKIDELPDRRRRRRRLAQCK